MKITRHTAPLWDLQTFYVWNDFEADQSDLFAIDTVTDTGTVLMGDTENGVATLTPSDATVADNDEVYLATPNEVFKVGLVRSLYGRCLLKWTETAAGVYNVGFGFMNAVGADTLADNGAGPKTSGSTFAIYKVDGGAVWKCSSFVNGTGLTSTSTAPAVGATWYCVEVIVSDYDQVSVEASYRVNGQKLLDSTTLLPIVHRVAIASATEMQMWVGAKLGAITNNDTTLVDYWYGAQNRGTGEAFF